MSGNKQWTVAEDELIISHEFTIDELMVLFVVRSRHAIIKRKWLLERYGLKGVRLWASVVRKQNIR
jgi:hypothetical protein